MKKKLGIFFVLLVLLFAHSMPLYAKSIKLNSTRVYITKGQKHLIKVKGYAHPTKWKSSNKKVARVSKNGTVTALKAGKTTITVKAKKKKLKCRIIVMDLNQKAVSLKAGASKQLKVSYGKSVKWYSSDPSVAVVKNGKVTAVKSGEAVITAKTRGRQLYCKVNVPYVAYTMTDMASYGSLSKAVINTDFAVNSPSYKSTNTRVLTVDEFGNMQANTTGSANVIVTIDGLTYVQTVKVYEAPAMTFLRKLAEYNEYVKKHGNAFRRNDTPEATYAKVRAIVSDYENGLSTTKARINCNAGCRWAFDEMGFNSSTIYASKGTFKKPFKGDMTRYLHRVTAADEDNDGQPDGMDLDGYDVIGLTYKEAVDRGLLRLGDILCFKDFTHTFTWSGNGYYFYDGGEAVSQQGGYSIAGMYLDYSKINFYNKPNMVISEVLRWN